VFVSVSASMVYVSVFVGFVLCLFLGKPNFFNHLKPRLNTLQKTTKFFLRRFLQDTFLLI
jgi:hypothetical protein